jgi:hypothetical protein
MTYCKLRRLAEPLSRRDEVGENIGIARSAPVFRGTPSRTPRSTTYPKYVAFTEASSCRLPADPCEAIQRFASAYPWSATSGQQMRRRSGLSISLMVAKTHRLAGECARLDCSMRIHCIDAFAPAPIPSWSCSLELILQSTAAKSLRGDPLFHRRPSNHSSNLLKQTPADSPTATASDPRTSARSQTPRASR